MVIQQGRPDEMRPAVDERPFRHAHLNGFWGSYTAVCLGVAAAAYREVVRVIKSRQPTGYSQPLAYQADVRRHVAQMSAELEAARLVAYHAAWLSDGRPPKQQPRFIARNTWSERP